MEFSLAPVDTSMIDEIVLVADQCGLAPWPRNDYLAEIGRPDSVFLALTAGLELAGFALGRIVPGRAEAPAAELYNIGVAPRFLGLGGGLMLLRGFLDQCFAGGASHVWLEVRASNQSAIKLYEKAGFAHIALRRKFFRNPDEDAIIMRAVLIVDETKYPQ